MVAEVAANAQKHGVSVEEAVTDELRALDGSVIPADIARTRHLGTASP